MATRTEHKLEWEVLPSRDSVDDDEWRVEAVEPDEGSCLVTIFSGPAARERAEEYAAFKRGQ